MKSRTVRILSQKRNLTDCVQRQPKYKNAVAAWRHGQKSSSTRSDIGFACKAELVKQIDALFPWVRNDADDVRENEEGTLFLFYNYKWSNIGEGDVQEFVFLVECTEL